MVGALAANNVSLSIAGSFDSYGTPVTFQSILDSIIPGLLPLLAILGVFAFFKKKGQKFGRVVIGIIVICLALSLIMACVE